MFLLAGWGGTLKTLCNAGIEKCPKCKNWSVFEVVEASKKITVFLIPVAKYSRQIYLMCPTCEWGAELTDSAARELVSTSHGRPTTETTKRIWSELVEDLPEDLSSVVEGHLASGLSPMEAWESVIRPTKERLVSMVGETHFNSVAHGVLRSLLDDDPPI